ncbi:membrane-targeted effector domain-containing toxin [Pseudomonas hormoni]|uniref:Membrane-targeted effector domain-containing toxin n=1 Tax=Pseudomonas hormoni TaxID=3093767 RepID=A0ABX8EXB1_9PSED|nr:membrane-targeted effector domain-containing toxin [Pseudomonas hormoni]QVW24389.1 membrane-targeted effector domain-containing toxin [Pseudomonas hormoni]
MNSPENRPLPNAADKAALKTIAATVVHSCPSLQDTAHQVASELLKKQGLQDIDPDLVYFHRFKLAQSSATSFTGWEHLQEKPYESMTLTQLVVHRFRATDQDNADLLDLYGGFYTAGPDAEDFNETNEVRLHGNDVLKAFWKIDFSALYTEKLTAFWDRHCDDFRTLAKCNFLSHAVQALEQKHLSGDDFQRVIDAVIGPVSWPVSLKMLQSTHPVGHDVRAFDVAGYVATNLLRIIDSQGRQMLYLPGDGSAFQVMETEAALHWWVLEQMNEDAPRQAFMTHFTLADRHAITENLGDLISRLVGTWGKSDHHLINQKNQWVSGDAFNWLQDSTRNAMFAEASLSLTSNGDLRKKLWIGYLSAGLKVFGPLAAVGWPVALPVIGASIANMGLNIDQAVNGKTAAERKEGILGAVLNGIDALFNVPFLRGAGSTLEVGVQVEAAEAAEMADLTESAATVESPAPTSLPVETPLPIPSETAVAPEVPARYQCNELLEGLTPDYETGKYQGIYRLDADPSYAILMNDNAYYVRYFADSKGGGFWAIIDPERPNQFVHSLPVRLNAQGDWGRMQSLRLRGGGQCVGKECAVDIPLEVREPLPPGQSAPEQQPSTSNPLRLVNTVYDAQPSLRSPLKSWALDLPQTHVRVFPNAMGNPIVQDPYEQYFAGKRTALLTATRTFYSELPWANLPPRPAIPAITRDMPIADLIERVFESAPGLVVGETLDRITSMRFMIENMPALARHAKTIYMRRLLNDFAQVELNNYFRTGDMSDDLRRYLTRLGTDPAERFNELELVKVARQNGVRIQALDCATRYKVKTPFTPPEEQMIANHLTEVIMSSDSLINDSGKWIVLTGPENTNTFRGIAGISELKGGIGLRIEEVNPGEGTAVDVDPGIDVDRGPLPNGGMMRGTHDTLLTDLRLQMPSSPRIWDQRALHNLLHRQGMYLFEKTAGNYTLIHRSGSGMLVRTPVQQLVTDHYVIHRPGWPFVNNVVFASVQQMSRQLNEMGMSLQSRLPV